MIFNKDYDMSLWLILSGDKEKRRMMASFIKELPEELLKSVREALKEFGDIDKQVFMGDTDITRDKSYWYCIDKDTETLEVGRSFVVSECEIENLHFILYPARKEEFEMISRDSGIMLGIFYDYFVGRYPDGEMYTIDFDLESYDLVKSSFNNFLVKSGDMLSRNRKKFTSVKINMELDNLSVDNLNEKVYSRKKSK